MFARVATFEGVDRDRIDAGLDQMRQEGGPPEGVPAKGFLLMLDRAAGKTVFVALFETEADLATGSATLDAMSPPPDSGMGTRTSVETYEVPISML